MRFILVSLVFIFVFSCSSDNSVEPVENNAPVIVSLVAEPDTVQFNSSLLLFCSAYDPDADDAITFEWECTYGTFLNQDSVSTWVSPELECKPWIICKVSDSFKEITADSIQVTVIDSVR